VLTPAGPPTARLVRRLARGMLRAAGIRLRLQGLEHLRGPGPWVLVANHVSYVDSVVALAALPLELRAVAKQEVARWPLVGTALRKAGHLLADRSDASRGVEVTASATELLRQGTSLLVFPEGTRARGPALLPFRLGAFKAAVDTGYPVVPVRIEGSRRVLPRGLHLPRPGLISLSLGEPLVPAERNWREMLQLRDKARARLTASGESAAR
jgi:fatty-acyl-CoA synthase